MSKCLFCRIVDGEIPSTCIHDDDLAVVIKDLYPKAPVHLLVIPKQHIESLQEIEQASDRLVVHLVRLLPVVAASQGLEDGFRTIINTGAGGGQEIPHLHFHLLGGGRLPGF